MQWKGSIGGWSLQSAAGAAVPAGKRVPAALSRSWRSGRCRQNPVREAQFRNAARITWRLHQLRACGKVAFHNALGSRLEGVRGCPGSDGRERRLFGARALLKGTHRLPVWC